MNIIVFHSFPRWLPQTQTWMYHQVRHLPDGIESHILCELTENLDQFYLPNIHNLLEGPRWRYYWDLWLRRLGVRNHLGYLVEQAKKHEAHILHSHFANVGWADLGAAKRAKLRHIITFYGFDVNYLPRLSPDWHERYQELFRSVDRILCEGPHMARSIEALGCPGERIVVHHLGVDLKEIAFKPRKWDGSEALKVLIAASFQEKKGIPYALEALGDIQKEVPLEITLLGDASEDPRSQIEKGKILEALERSGLGEKTRRLGYQPYRVLLKEAYRHHVFLSPSVTAKDGDSEGGLPFVLIEMAATGMPVVSTFHSDIPEAIEHGKTGLLARERDVEGIKEHLAWLIEHRTQWLPMVSEARKHIEEEYDARKQGERLAGIYRELVEK